MSDLQEEINQKVVSFAFQATKFTGKVVVDAMRKFLAAQNGKTKIKHGKQSVKSLIRQNAGVTSIEISDGNIKDFERIARKYGVDFAVKKDSTVEPPRYLVFFKARDQDAITQAFKEYVAKKSKEQDRPPFKQVLKKLLEKVQQMNRHRERSKDRNRGGPER